MFDVNIANEGAALNLIRYGAQLYNVTFKNNRQSAVRVSFVCKCKYCQLLLMIKLSNF